MRNVVRVLRAAEKALAEGNDNCGGEPDNVYYEPLQQVRAEITRLVAAAPDVDLAARWCTGEVNSTTSPHPDLMRIAQTLRSL